MSSNVLECGFCKDSQDEAASSGRSAHSEMQLMASRSTSGRSIPVLGACSRNTRVIETLKSSLVDVGRIMESGAVGSSSQPYFRVFVLAPFPRQSVRSFPKPLEAGANEERKQNRSERKNSIPKKKIFTLRLSFQALNPLSYCTHTNSKPVFQQRAALQRRLWTDSLSKTATSENHPWGYPIPFSLS